MSSRALGKVAGLVAMAAILSWQSAAWALPFNGFGDNQIDSMGYYYAITGGKLPPGQTRTGASATGGTFRYITDDPAWNTWYGPSPAYAIDVWHKDGWFPQNVSIALTLKNSNSIVFDNNGIEDGTYGNYYDATAQGLTSANTPGLYRGYSMSNNFDWIYAGYLKLTQATTFDTIIGYFDPNSGLDPNNPLLGYRMNFWSEATGGTLLPVNTGSFDGDVLSSDRTAGTFSVSDSGVDRVFGVDMGSAHDDIWRLTYQLNTPITLQPGDYYFSHDAVIIPEPLTAALGTLGLVCLSLCAGGRRARRA